MRLSFQSILSTAIQQYFAFRESRASWSASQIAGLDEWKLFQSIPSDISDEANTNKGSLSFPKRAESAGESFTHYGFKMISDPPVIRERWRGEYHNHRK